MPPHRHNLWLRTRINGESFIVDVFQKTHFIKFRNAIYNTFPPRPQVTVHVDGREVLKESLPSLRALWEDTSFQLERLQANEMCVKQEEEGLATRTQPYLKLTFDPCEMSGLSQLSTVVGYGFQSAVWWTFTRLRQLFVSFHAK